VTNEKLVKENLSDKRKAVESLTKDINNAASELQLIKDRIARNPSRQYDADIESGYKELAAHEKTLKEILIRQSKLGASVTSYTEKLEQFKTYLEQVFHLHL